jgi:uncharacterized membrane protein YdbT with pleckstrin-like domain
MMESQQETTLAKVRLHWAFFIPVLGFAVGPILALLPFIFVMRGLLNVLGQMGTRLNQPSGMPSFYLIWLLPLVLYFVIVLVLLLGTWFTYSKSEVTLTNRRLVFRTGFLSRRSGELPLENVESIYIHEPLLGRIFGYGTVMVTTVGGARFPMWFIGCPQSFHSTLQKAVLNAKNSIGRTPKPPASESPAQDDDSRYMPKG